MKLIRLSLFSVVLIIIAPMSSSANGVLKKEWTDSMSTAVPAAFCQSNQYFRQCFNVTQIECEETAMSTTRICLKKNEDNIPDIFNQPEDCTYWGKIIGACAGESYELVLVLQKKKISNQKCDNPDYWR